MSEKDSQPPAYQPPRERRQGDEAGPSRPPTVVVKSSNAILASFLSVLLAVGLVVSLGFNLFSYMSYSRYFQTGTELEERYHSGDRYARDKIAVISVEGVMLEGEGFAKDQIDRVRKDDRVKAVVLRVNSPGGAVSAADYLLHHLNELKEEKEIPLVASFGPVAASGGYYVAMAVGDEEQAIYSEPTTITGSIGVIIPRYDISDALEQLHVKSDSIVSHEFKELGSWTKELTPQERSKLQKQVDLMFRRFKEKVKEGRPMFRNDEDALNQVATGEVFTGEQAKDLMLVDEVGFIEDAVERAAELANLSEDKYRVVRYRKIPTLADALTGTVEAQRNPLDARALMEMTTPRAYYLYTWLPPLLSR